MEDLFFEKDYGKLYESIEQGSCEIFEFENKNGSVRHLFLKKKIPTAIRNIHYYDLATPYGYGGPIMTVKDERYRKELAFQFQEAFKIYCHNHNIVSEFIRFHPLLSNAEDFKECYDVQFRRRTTGTTLSTFNDPVQAEFSKSARRNIRKAIQSGVTYNVSVNPTDLIVFKEIYHHTMNRNNAESIYYFNDDYFSNCVELLGKHLVLTEVKFEEQTIGMGLSFAYKNIIHTHLSGTYEEFHHLSPAYVLQYALVEWGKENRYKLIHDGGGRTGSLEDKLYLFKKQFGKNTDFQYFVGYKVWNEEIYSQLNELKAATN